MKSGSYREAQLAAANDEASLFASHGAFRSCYPDRPPQWKETAVPSAPGPRLDEVSRGYSRYCDQPMSWGIRLFGLAGTTLIVGLVLAAALFTWKAVHQPLRATSQPLTVVELHPPATPPEPLRNVTPGRKQVEKRTADERSAAEQIPVPLMRLPASTVSAREAREPVRIADPGPVVPQTSAPKSIAAPTADRLSYDARPNWEGLILAHLERFRRYPARARAARQQGTVHVRFRMNRAGMVLSSAVVKKSGSFDLDQAALDTLRRAQPLPAIPADMPDEVELSVPVEYYLSR